MVTDIDGVWTDGGMYYDNQGNELKRFCTSDGMGVALCRAMGIPVVIVTGEQTQVVANRAKKLGIELVFQGVQDKARCMSDLSGRLGIELSDFAYIGDDYNDLRLLRSVGFSGCPANANPLVQSAVDIVIPLIGGRGAFRYFVEHILLHSGKLDEAVATIVG